jgi:POT family proton-dependent oligopeptide transporter
MWERFSYYGMRALLILFMTSKTGFGWDDTRALSIYTWYIALVYLTPIGGGYLADRVLGQRRAVMMGGGIIMTGHFLLALPGQTAFYAGLGALILGNGLFKPNISTMVGGLYREKDPRRDSGFSIFYIGINLGGFLGPLVCGWLGEKVSWHWGFAAAGFGMLLGLIVFAALQHRMLGTVGLPPDRTAVKRAEKARTEPRAPLTRVELDRIIVLVVIIFFAGAFWAAYEQSGGLVNLYTERHVDRVVLGWEVPATWFQSINSFFIFTLSPFFAWLWLTLSERRRDPSPILKMAAGLLFAGLSFTPMVLAAYQNSQGRKSSAVLVVLAYLVLTVGELCISPVGLSLTTKLAPRHLAAGLMGAWFLSNFMGNKLSGEIGKQAKVHGNTAVFAGVAIGAVAIALLLLALSRLLYRMMHGAAETKTLEELAKEQGGDGASTATVG